MHGPFKIFLVTQLLNNKIFIGRSSGLFLSEFSRAEVILLYGIEFMIIVDLLC